MHSAKENEEYLNLVNHILKNEKFQKTKEIEHHGITRFEHSMRVSYYSYKVTKFLKLDYEKVATAGLLHDFFLTDGSNDKKIKFLSTFNHPKIAVENATKEFNITEKEKDIIRTHMFPINLSVPKYFESWIVSGVDKIVGTWEFIVKFKYKLAYATNLFMIFVLNSIK